MHSIRVFTSLCPTKKADALVREVQKALKRPDASPRRRASRGRERPGSSSAPPASTEDEEDDESAETGVDEDL